MLLNRTNISFEQQYIIVNQWYNSLNKDAVYYIESILYSKKSFVELIELFRTTTYYSELMI